MKLLVFAFKPGVGLFKRFAQFDELKHPIFQGLPLVLGHDALHEMPPLG